MNYHRGINTTSIAGDGLAGLPGLLITIAFVFMFAGMFVPSRSSDWLLVLFVIVEIGAACLYVVIQRHNRKDSVQLMRDLHRINTHNVGDKQE